MGNPENHQPERRKYPRTKTPVQIELRPEGSNVPIRVQTADIGVGGCYVEMGITLEVGSRLTAVFWLGDQKMVVSGLVITCHPQFGNGIEFVGLSKPDQDKLTSFLKTISE